MSTTGMSSESGLSPSETSLSPGPWVRSVRVSDSGHGIRCSSGGSYVGGEGKKVLTSLMDPERGPQETVKSTLGCGHLHKDMNHTVIS